LPIVPFRGLSEKGILFDPSPYQLDLNAWSGGSNIRFHGNKVERSPIWREVYTTLPAVPRWCWGYKPSTGQDVLFIVGVDGNLYSYSSATIATVSPTDVLMGISPNSFTQSFSGDVSYVNSPASIPLYWGPGATQFATLPGWDASWLCRSIRAFQSYVIALNVTKGAAQIPNMVKWSDITSIGVPPADWNADLPTSSSGENPLQDLDTPIVDGLPMRSLFVIYSENQIWGMTPSGDNFIFDFQRLFSEGGMISPNCAVEVEGRHYVFGPTDIYVHDGVSKQSIIDGRNRDYVFRNLDTGNVEACFVSYNPALNEITFAYPSGSGTEYFQDGSGSFANRAAVYSVTGDSWSFIDLPNVPAMTLVNIDTIPTYATIPSTTTYANVGGSYFDDQNSYTQTLVSVSQPLAVGPNQITLGRILAYDFVNLGRLSYPFSTECNATTYVQRTGIDLEQVGSDIRTYKTVRRMYPLIEVYRNPTEGQTNQITIQIGSSNTPAGAVSWGPKMGFNPVTDYKIDMRQGGRYLGVRFTTTQQIDFSIDGFDLDVTPGGTR